ncbi:MAG: fused MFS/spermidine synthase [Blastocatellia bacterium]
MRSSQSSTFQESGLQETRLGALFAVTLLLNALLLFLVQPMIARMLLPYLGGTPAVWNTCMVFFQTLLLAGYAYSHWITRRLGVRWQIVAHCSLLALAAAVFPLEISEASLQSLSGQTIPIFWLLKSLLLMVGLPFLMLSTGGPLLQQWFSTTGHSAAKDPYFLYSASNIGSLVALLGYPLLIEPNLRLSQQSWLLTVGYAALIALILLCAAARWKAASSASIENSTTGNNPYANLPTDSVATIGWARRLRWVLLAFVPSSLMLGATTYLSTDISPIPLLWVMPLSLYLLTFILAFARKPLLPLQPLVKWMPLLALVLTLLILTQWSLPTWASVFLHLLFFFAAALVCHSQLANDRPPTARLTEFYLWLSVGGMLGGIFNSLLAPVVFSTVAEYPIAIVLALLLRPKLTTHADKARDRWMDFALPAIVGALTVAFAVLPQHWGLSQGQALIFSLCLPAAIGYTFGKRPVRFALALGAIMLGSGFSSQFHYGQTLNVERNFFGVLRVARSDDGQLNMFYHGNTKHGRQYIDPNRRCEPLSYYHRKGPLGQALEAFSATAASPNIAVVGLGTGAMASYAQAGQAWTFYEIDPAALAIAQNETYFSYLTCAASPVKTILGDGRLQLLNAPDRHYGLIVLDAFSSDAIPTHLLTKEAMELYLSKLAPKGQLLFHVSNKYLDLRPVIADLAANAKLTSYAVVFDAQTQRADGGSGLDPSNWMAVARAAEDFGTLATHPRWQKLEGRPQAKIWTDDYSNVLGAMKWK